MVVYMQLFHRVWFLNDLSHVTLTLDTENRMKLLLDSLVLSHIYYTLPVWGPSLNVQLSSRLKWMQNRAVRLAFSLKKCDHVSDYYKQLHWLPLDQFVKFRSVCSMYK